MNTIIMTDSCCDLKHDYVIENNIALMKLNVTIGEEEVQDDLGQSLEYKDFYERISYAWHELEKMFSCNENIMLVTHSGVIQVILSLVEGKTYSNKGITGKIGNAEIVTVQYDFNLKKYGVQNERN